MFDGRRAGAIPYSEIQVQIDQTRFVEDLGVPSDSRIVAKTWQYVNRDGGPDRRFRNNRQLPVVLYELMHLSSQSGLSEVYMFSKTGVVQPFDEALRAMTKAIGSLPAAKEAATT